MNRRVFARAIGVLTALLLAVPASACRDHPFASDRIIVTVEGSGPDVILIPGLTSSPTAWRTTIPAVPGYRYHKVQVKGFAGLPAEANATGPVAAPVAAEIARYIGERGLRRPAVIGHSMGGTMGLMLAARHPSLVSKVMVVDQIPFMGAVFGPPGTTAEGIRPTADALVAQMKAATPEARARNLQAMSDAMVRNEEQRAIVIAEARASDPDVSANAYHELIVTDLRPELAGIAVPTTILYVTPAGLPVTDEQMDAAYQTAYADLNGATLVRVPDSAHFIMSDNPAFFQARMKAFLAD